MGKTHSEQLAWRLDSDKAIADASILEGGSARRVQRLLYRPVPDEL